MSQYRKYSSSLFSCMLLSIVRNVFNLNIHDFWLLSFYTNDFLVRKIIPLMHKDLVMQTPGYGRKYEKSSYWLAKPHGVGKEDPVIIYIHGGGYFMQTQTLQLRSLLTVYHLLDPSKKDKTSILLLDYDLVGTKVSFPTQLEQLHGTYRQLVQEGHTNIILMGDSAGGHLSISYTQYLKSLGSRAIYPSKLILISPWVKIVIPEAEVVEGSSWTQNCNRDMISKPIHSPSETARVIFGETDPFSLVHGVMSKVPRQRSDWLDIPTFSSPKYDVFVIAGEDESFRDDILEFCKHALNVPWYGDGFRYGHLHEFYDREHFEFERRGEEGNANVTMYVERWGVHDATLVLEAGLALRVAGDLRKGKRTKLGDVDAERYFGITRLVKFLNETL